jgi:hypothetical protein
LAGFKNHPLAPHPRKKRSLLYMGEGGGGRGGGSFCRFLFQAIHNAEDREIREIEAEIGSEQ